MSNNRMWLVNETTGEKILIAKYYPSTGWWTYHEDLGKKLDALFDANAPSPPTMWGNVDWRIVYDVDNPQP